MNPLARVLTDIGLLLARFAFAALLVSQAWLRWHHYGTAHEIAYLRAHDISSPEILVWGAIVLEAVGAVLLVVGLGTRLVALAVLAQEVTIIALLRWSTDPWNLHGTMAFQLAAGALALTVLAAGAGRVALDVAFRRTPEPDRQVIDERAGP